MTLTITIKKKLLKTRIYRNMLLNNHFVSNVYKNFFGNVKYVFNCNLACQLVFFEKYFEFFSKSLSQPSGYQVMGPPIPPAMRQRRTAMLSGPQGPQPVLHLLLHHKQQLLLTCRRYKIIKKTLTHISTYTYLPTCVPMVSLRNGRIIVFFLFRICDSFFDFELSDFFSHSSN